ncbi:Activity-regulated cytoskeleton-associated protein [Folsomia candida]|uniref:Activity-regulated cytoskeleton-associated protein n=1 Tax=Folsomia candida TaxID=158441 RepID=A0A226DCL9_FOLCA|nr:Activity-regulated cytoskeleton-associated protein [Folsomia candida]
MDNFFKTLHYILAPPLNRTTGSPKDIPKPVPTSTSWPWIVTWSMETMGIAVVIGVAGFLVYLSIMYLVRLFFPTNIDDDDQSKSVSRKKLQLFTLKLTRFEKEIIKLRKRQDDANDEMGRIYTGIDEIGDDVTGILNRFTREINQKVNQCMVHTSLDLEHNVKDLTEHLNRMDKECNYSQVQLTESLSDLQKQIDDLHDNVSPSPDPLLSSILGPHYPISLPATQSVQNYVDGKVESLSAGLEHCRRSTTHQIENNNEKMKEEIRNLRKELEQLKKQSLHSYTIPPPSYSQTTPVHPVIVSSQAIPPPQQTVTLTAPIPTTMAATITSNNQVLPTPITTPTTTILSDGTTANVPIIYHSVGNIPPPKFSPNLDTAENFLQELEGFMRRKRLAPEDWILMLPSVFSSDRKQSTWWQRTKLMAKTWDEFKSNFIIMYGSDCDKMNSLEKLLNRRQSEKEDFHTFALQMDMQYRKVYQVAPSTNESEVLQFIAERALPHLRIPLFGCGAKSLVDLINFGQKIHNATVSERNNTKSPPPSSKNNKTEKPTSPSTTNKSNKGEEKKGQAGRRTFKCSNCPGSTNHSTERCFKGRNPPAAVRQAQGSEVSGNGKEE